MTDSLHFYKSHKGCFVFFLLVLIIPQIHGDLSPLLEDSLPLIQKLDRDDPLFLQLINEVEAFHQQKKKGGLPRQAMFMRYEVKENDSLFTLAARLTVPAASLATINRLSGPTLTPGTILIVPSLPGLYVHEANPSSLEKLLLSRLEKMVPSMVVFTRKSQQEFFKFYPDEEFTPSERRFFLVKYFINPVPGARISSSFGSRRNPFGTNITFHAGIDLVKDLGSPVAVIADGVVRETGFETLYGNYIIVDHYDGWRSFYAHLRSIRTRTGATVSQGQAIATLGNSGKTTGTHLHLEIYQNGEAKDPAKFIVFN